MRDAVFRRQRMCQTLRVGVEADAVPHGLQSSRQERHHPTTLLVVAELQSARGTQFYPQAIQQRVASTEVPSVEARRPSSTFTATPDVFVRDARLDTALVFQHRRTKKSSPVPHRIIPSTSNNLTDNDSVASRSSVIIEESANCASAESVKRRHLDNAARRAASTTHGPRTSAARI